MNVLSLFSGIGGLELGLERAGMTVIGQVEINEYCRRVLAKHWPEVPRHDDVTTAVDWWRSEPRPTVHVVAGGFPCQPVSLAGLGLAQADDRWLWPAMWAVIRELRPDFAIMENVPGLLGRGVGDVFGDLAAGGYDADWDCIPAASVGAPHRRDRVFIVAYANRRRLEIGAQLDGQAKKDPADWHPRRRHVDGLGHEVANPESDGWRSRRTWRPTSDCADRASVATAGLANAEGGRCNPSRTSGIQAGPDGLFGHAGQRRGSDAWATEPDVGRVAHGIPNRVDRLRALGNAVVPQVAEHIGRLVMAGVA